MGQTIGRMAGILAMASMIINDQIILICQKAPKWKIGIDGKAIAVTKNQSGTKAVAMLAKPDNGAISHRQFHAISGFGYGKCHFFCSQFWVGFQSETSLTSVANFPNSDSLHNANQD